MIYDPMKNRGLYKSLMSVALLLVLGLTASCNGFPQTQIYKTVTIPMLPQPTIHEEPSLTIPELPSPQVVTLDEMMVYDEACSDYKHAGQDGFSTLEEVQSEWPNLTELDACSFAVYGHPTQIWLNFEAELALAAGHKEEWVNQARTYKRALEEQYRAIKEATEKLEKQLSE